MVQGTKEALDALEARAARRNEEEAKEAKGLVMQQLELESIKDYG